MMNLNSKRIIGVLSVLSLLSSFVFIGMVYSDYYISEAYESSLSQTTQELPPVASGGQDIVTYVSKKTMFRGHGSSIDDNIVNYEWDFDGDGIYDWASAESGSSYHRYKVPGNYHAFFRVTDSHGNFSTDTIEVQIKRGHGKQELLIQEEDSLDESLSALSVVEQASAGSDGIKKRYVVMINGSGESRFWDDVTFMYSTLIDDYQFTPESIYLFNYNGTNSSGENPDDMIDYPAQKVFIDDVFTELGSIIDNDDELFVWITGHGRGYNGLESEYYGYLDGSASVDPGDEEDYLESEFKLRSLYIGGNYDSNHGMNVWKVFYTYYSSGNYKMWRNKYLSQFKNTYFENIDARKRDNDVFIERFVDYLEGDYNRNGIIETNIGEVYDYDGDGIPPYDASTGVFDEDDWGSIDYYDDDVTHINTQVPGSSYIIFDANLDNHLDIDIDYDRMIG
jgi:hypothetical protein